MLNLTNENFSSTIDGDDTVIIDFWAPWCGPCRQFGPIFEKVAEQHSDVTFAKLNTDEQQEIAGALGIMSIPTLMAFRGGALVFNQAGAMNETQFNQIVEQVKALDLDEIKKQVAEQNKQA